MGAFRALKKIGRINITSLSEHINMVFIPSCSRFWIWLMMLTKHCLTVRLKQHCFQVIRPQIKSSSFHLRQKDHAFDLPRCTIEFQKKFATTLAYNRLTAFCCPASLFFECYTVKSLSQFVHCRFITCTLIKYKQDYQQWHYWRTRTVSFFSSDQSRVGLVSQSLEE